jgi:hypothetical protein
LYSAPFVSYSQRRLSTEEEILMPRPVKKSAKNVVAMPVPAATLQSTAPRPDDVARRAFELYCERGYQDGYDVQDWLQAERELRRTASTAA